MRSEQISSTVLLDGTRINSCLALAVAHDGCDITTAAGLGRGMGAPAGPGNDANPADPTAELHPLQRAFLDADAFQCGYCTPGQICSAAGMLDEAAAEGADLTDDEIRERMSGNLCRCGAYVNIVAAIRSVADGNHVAEQGS